MTICSSLIRNSRVRTSLIALAMSTAVVAAATNPAAAECNPVGQPVYMQHCYWQLLQCVGYVHESNTSRKKGYRKNKYQKIACISAAPRPGQNLKPKKS